MSETRSGNRRVTRRDFLRTTGLAAAGYSTGLARSGFLLGAAQPAQADGLLIRGGEIVTAEGRSQRDVRVRDELIVEIGTDLEPNGERVIDAGGLSVLPGGIDPHAHLTQSESAPFRFRPTDDLTSGSEAGLAGGVTTIGIMTFPGQEDTLWDAIERDARFVREKAIADVMLHPVLFDPSEFGEEEIGRLVAAGHTSIKIFMVSAAFERHLRNYVRVMHLAGQAGILPLMHCEDGAIIAEATRALVEAGKGSLRYYAESRPLSAEVVATRRAIGYSEATNAPIYLVHLSAAQPLAICRAAQARGLPIFVETRPVYLHLTSERYMGPDGPLYVAQPPLREAEDVEALWEGLRDGSVHTLGTDHVGWTKEQKMNPSLSVEDLLPGVPNLQEMLPMLHSEGVLKGRISLERFVEISAANPAKLFGLYPHKGTIAVGSDADLALWDRSATRTIQLADMRSRGGFSLFEGREVTGWPAMTIRRGEVVYEAGAISGRPGSGRLLSRGPTERV